MERIVGSTPLKLLNEFLQINPKYWYRLIFGVEKYKAKDSDLIKLMIDGASFVRWGDGETAISRGKSISYQEFNEDLKIKLWNILQLESKDLILGLPWAFYSSLLNREWNLRKFKILLSTRIQINRLYKKNPSAGFATAEFWYINSHNLQAILSEICHGKNILLIASRREYLKLCPVGTHFIESPRTDAFNAYLKINSNLQTELLNSQNDGKKTIVICAIGPASKAIAADHFKSIQVIDVGHGFDFAIHGFGQFAWRISDK